MTLSLMEQVGYEFAYMFKYSERPGTFSQRHMPDDIADDVKTRRLNEIIALQNTLSEQSNRRDVGREFEILVEGVSKRRDDQLFGRTSQNKVVVFDRGGHAVGDYVRVRVTGCTSAPLLGVFFLAVSHDDPAGGNLWVPARCDYSPSAFIASSIRSVSSSRRRFGVTVWRSV